MNDSDDEFNVKSKKNNYFLSKASGSNGSQLHKIVISSDDDDDDQDTNNITELVSESSSDDGTSERCAICLGCIKGDIGSPDAVGCDHYFCLLCILEWAKNNATCPQDRRHFNKVLVMKYIGGSVTEKIPVEIKKQDEAFDYTAADLTYCEVCGSCEREDCLLLCDGCDLGYHLECLTPPLSEVPVAEWFCPSCMKADLPQVVGHSYNSNATALSNVHARDKQSALLHMFRRPSATAKKRLIPRTRATERILQRILTTRKNEKKKKFIKPRKLKRKLHNYDDDSGEEVKKSSKREIEHAFSRARPHGSINDDDIDAYYNDDNFADKLLESTSLSFGKSSRKSNALQVLQNDYSKPLSSYRGRSFNPKVDASQPSMPDILTNILEDQSVLLTKSMSASLIDNKKAKKTDVAKMENIDVTGKSNIMSIPLPSKGTKESQNDGGKSKLHSLNNTKDSLDANDTIYNPLEEAKEILNKNKKDYLNHISKTSRETYIDNYTSKKNDSKKRLGSDKNESDKYKKSHNSKEEKYSISKDERYQHSKDEKYSSKSKLEKYNSYSKEEKYNPYSKEEKYSSHSRDERYSSYSKDKYDNNHSKTEKYNPYSKDEKYNSYSKSKYDYSSKQGSKSADRYYKEKYGNKYHGNTKLDRDRSYSKEKKKKKYKEQSRSSSSSRSRSRSRSKSKSMSRSRSRSRSMSRSRRSQASQDLRLQKSDSHSSKRGSHYHSKSPERKKDKVKKSKSTWSHSYYSESSSTLSEHLDDSQNFAHSIHSMDIPSLNKNNISSLATVTSNCHNKNEFQKSLETITPTLASTPELKIESRSLTNNISVENAPKSSLPDNKILGSNEELLTIKSNIKFLTDAFINEMDAKESDFKFKSQIEKSEHSDISEFKKSDSISTEMKVNENDYQTEKIPVTINFKLKENHVSNPPINLDNKTIEHGNLFEYENKQTKHINAFVKDSYTNIDLNHETLEDKLKSNRMEDIFGTENEDEESDSPYDPCQEIEAVSVGSISPFSSRSNSPIDNVGSFDEIMIDESHNSIMELDTSSESIDRDNLIKSSKLKSRSPSSSPEVHVSNNSVLNVEVPVLNNKSVPILTNSGFVKPFDWPCVVEKKAPQPDLDFFSNVKNCSPNVIEKINYKPPEHDLDLFGNIKTHSTKANEKISYMFDSKQSAKVEELNTEGGLQREMCNQKVKSFFVDDKMQREICNQKVKSFFDEFASPVKLDDSDSEEIIRNKLKMIDENISKEGVIKQNQIQSYERHLINSSDSSKIEIDSQKCDITSKKKETGIKIREIKDSTVSTFDEDAFDQMISPYSDDELNFETVKVDSKKKIKDSLFDYKSSRKSLVDKSLLEEKVVEEAKKFLNPYYQDRCFSKEIFKEIMAKIVKKVLEVEITLQIQPKKIQKLVDGYVQVYLHRCRKKKKQLEAASGNG